jgi:hypothetical protein
MKKTTGVAQDVHILHGLIAHVLGQETQIRHIPSYYPQCPEAEVNFFIEVINPSLFFYASKNIWIPNPEWTYKTWQPYANMVDEIWVKTHEAEKLFRQWTDKVRYVGWTSIDKVQPEKKNYFKAIVPVGKNIWRNPKPVFQAYYWIWKNLPSLYTALPEAHIVHSPEHVPLPPVPEELKDKIILHSEVMKEEDYDALLQECGLCICTSAAEGFGHAVNEAMSTGCNVILSPIDAFRELINYCWWTSDSIVTPHPQCLGQLEDISVPSLVEALQLYCASKYLERKRNGESSRRQYEERHQTFIKRMTSILTEFKETPTYSIQDRLPKEEDLPSVSVITITKDRRAFIPLAKYCFIAKGYPEEKLEWVIVDEGVDQIKDLVSDLPNVKYVLVDPTDLPEGQSQLSIGAKRNLGVAAASHDVLVFLDDDDVYPNNSIVTRVAYMLAEPRKQCVFSTTIPCYDVHEAKSFMNVPPGTLPMCERVSEATLCFTRAFWEARKFPDQQIAEGNAFLHGREDMCRELSPQEIIVSLVHKKNTSSRKPPVGMEQNGCHYGFADELFTLVSEIGASI